MLQNGTKVDSARAPLAAAPQPRRSVAGALARGAQGLFERAAAPLARCLRGVNDACPGGPPRPLAAAPNRWSYVPFGDTCDSTGARSVGLSINPRPGAERLVIFLTGGPVGADGMVCSEPVGTHARGMLSGWWARGEGIFNRADPRNPLAEASYVVIPAVNYDRHMGDHQARYPGANSDSWTLCAHRGGANFKAFLRRIAPTFPDVKQVVLAGESAGGFGASFQVPRVRRAFPGKELLVINDSGPYLPPGHELFNGAKVEAWGLRNAVPRGWERLLPTPRDPQAGSWNLYGLTHASNQASGLTLRAGPPVRTALVTSVWDGCIAESYGLTLEGFENAVRALPALATQHDPNTRVFLINWPGHTWLKRLPAVHDNGTRPMALGPFLDGFLRGLPVAHVAQAPWAPPAAPGTPSAEPAQATVQEGP